MICCYDSFERRRKNLFVEGKLRFAAAKYVERKLLFAAAKNMEREEIAFRSSKNLHNKKIYGKPKWKLRPNGTI